MRSSLSEFRGEGLGPTLSQSSPMLSDDTPPLIPQALIRYLEKTIPDRCQPLATPDRALWAYVGKIELIRFLRSVMEQQQEEALSTNSCASPD